VAQKARRDDEALDLDRPEQFLKRERAIQNAGVMGLTLFAVAGLAGLFGNGPLAEATAASGNATIRYERFTRQTFRTVLDISATGVTTSTVSITLPRAFLDRVDMLELRPADTLTHMDATTATFEVPADKGIASLVLHYEAQHFGVLAADVRVGGAPPARVRQIVFF
jgi:hypothetical protein